jgi:hypothetical protein
MLLLLLLNQLLRPVLLLDMRNEVLPIRLFFPEAVPALVHRASRSDVIVQDGILGVVAEHGVLGVVNVNGLDDEVLAWWVVEVESRADVADVISKSVEGVVHVSV